MHVRVDLLTNYPIVADGNRIRIGDWHYRLQPDDCSPPLSYELERAVMAQLGAAQNLLQALKVSRYALTVVLEGAQCDPSATTISRDDGRGGVESVSLAAVLQRLTSEIEAADL